MLLASRAVPARLPPVPINIEVDGEGRTELHVDGGVSALLFLPPLALGKRKPEEGQPAAAGTNVSVIVASKLKIESRPVDRRFTRVSEEALGMLLQADMESDLLRVYSLASSPGPLPPHRRARGFAARRGLAVAGRAGAEAGVRRRLPVRPGRDELPRPPPPCNPPTSRRRGEECGLPSRSSGAVRPRICEAASGRLHLLQTFRLFSLFTSCNYHTA